MCVLYIGFNMGNQRASATYMELDSSSYQWKFLNGELVRFTQLSWLLTNMHNDEHQWIQFSWQYTPAP